MQSSLLDVLFFGKSYSIVCGDFSHALQKKKAFSKNKNIIHWLQLHTRTQIISLIPATLDKIFSLSWVSSVAR